MEILFETPSESDVIRIFEAYLNAGEPDSPTVHFRELSDKQKGKTVRGFQNVARVASVNGVKVGWVTIIDRLEEPSINIGFGVFPEERGHGIGAVVVGHVARRLRKEKPDRQITAGTRAENMAAIRTLEKAGFIHEDFEESEPAGNWTEVVPYSKYRYP